MKVTIEMELTEQEQRLLLDCSVERVLNNAIKCGALVEKFAKKDWQREDGSVLWQDCEELKPLVVRCWNMARNEVFKKRTSPA